MASTRLHRFKEPSLEGGHLLVTTPGPGIGNLIVSDMILQGKGMDHVASIDTDAMAPVAMPRDGVVRFPMRIHASNGLAVLRSEAPVPPAAARGIAREVVAWAKDVGVAQIVTLDALRVMDDGKGTFPRLVCTGSSRDVLERARVEGLQPFAGGVLAGLTASLPLQGRVEGVDVLGILAPIADPDDDIASVQAFGDALPSFVPGLEMDQAEIDAKTKEARQAVEALHRQVQQTMKEMQGEGAQQPMFG